MTQRADDSSPLSVITGYIDAMSSGDFPAGMAYFADDIVGIVPGRSDLAGEYHGRAEVERYLTTVLSRITGHVTVNRIDTLIGQNHVALMVEEHLGDLVFHRTNVYRIRHGKIVEIRIFEGDQYAVDDHLGAPATDSGALTDPVRRH